MNERLKSWLTWTPRVLAIVLILFLGLFALDVFEEERSIGEILVALFMHLVPNFILLAALLVAWRWKRFGGLLFLGLAVFSVVFFRNTSTIVTYLITTLPASIIGLLFLLDGFTERRPPLRES